LGLCVVIDAAHQTSGFSDAFYKVGTLMLVFLLADHRWYIGLEGKIRRRF